jgi:hypothetical protein
MTGYTLSEKALDDLNNILQPTAVLNFDHIVRMAGDCWYTLRLFPLLFYLIFF